MRAVVCPYCQGVNQLPEPWSATGYTCAHCRGTVPLLMPVSQPTPFTDLHEDDEPIRRPRYHDRRRGDVGRAMADGFGWTVGEQLAKGMFALIVTAIIAGVFWLMWTGRIKF